MFPSQDRNQIAAIYGSLLLERNELKTKQQSPYEKEKYTPDRIPHSAKSSYQGVGGKLLKAAEAIARTSHESVPEDQISEFSNWPDGPQKRAERNKVAKLIKTQEERALYLWARKNKFLLDNNEFDQQWERDGHKGEAEHEVYYDDKNHQWVKRNNLSYHSSFLEYFHRIALHNAAFPEAPLTLIGFVVKDNHLWPVITQPHVEAERGASQKEVYDHMTSLGFKHLGGDDYYNEETGVRVEDLHDENVLVAPDGTLRIVDPVIYLDDAGKKKRLAAHSELEF